MDCNAFHQLKELYEEFSFLELESKTNLTQFERMSLHCQDLESQLLDMKARYTTALKECDNLHEFKIKAENLEDAYNALKMEALSVEEAFKQDIATLRNEVQSLSLKFK